ncbi:Cell morphogenesis protein PAG1 [Entomortierella chlamydospora]|nr:Cell morphogenesis protein PAG1 [Entomortierella chlamydospora]
MDQNGDNDNTRDTASATGSIGATGINAGGHNAQESASTRAGPGPAAVGSGHRPALNDWKFPSTPRVATPAPLEHQTNQPDASSSPATSHLQQFHQQQPLDYFNQPTSSYTLTPQQQLQQQQSHQQLQFQQHQSHSTNTSQLRDGSQTPRSPYSFVGSSDGLLIEQQAYSAQDSSIHLQSGVQARGPQRSTHSHSQSQDSVGGSIDHPMYQYQLQNDVAQPTHAPLPDPSLLQQPQGLTVSPHQMQTPSEFALKMLFTQFVKMAEAKLNAMVHLPLQDTEPDMLSPLKQGVDPKFDKLLESLGSIARHRPKPVIDCVMLWRKSKIESSEDSPVKPSSGEWSVNFKFRDPKTVIKERKTVVSLFIMSRSLIEIVRQVQKDTLPDELGFLLEETIFSQLENMDPEFIQRSSNRTANMNVLVELMGSLSTVRFATVSDRFIAKLEKYKIGVPVKDKDRDMSMEMLIRGMRYLNLKASNCRFRESLEESADFLQSCAGFFKMARGIRIKHAYAELFVQLLTPVAKVALAEVNHPNWSKTVELIYPKARKMTNKPRHVQVALPLATILLCVSKKDFFIRHWLLLFDLCREKFKDKVLRQTALNCTSQLLWVFLYRYSDETGSTFRTLDTIVKALFPPNRKSSGMVEGSLGYFIRILHFIGARHADYATRSIIFSLVNLESLSNVIFTNLTMDMVSPERMTIAIRSFMLILADIDKGSNRPPFPTAGDAVNVVSDSPPSSDYLEPSVINRAGMRDSYDQMTAVLGKIAIVCDRNYGHTLILEDKYTTPRSMFSAAALMATATGDGGASIVHQYSTFAVSYSKEKQVYFDLMASWVSCLPRCMPSGIPLVKLVEMLSRYTAHVDPELRKASAAALVRIAKQCSTQVAVAGYSEFVCTVEDRLSELLAGMSVPGSSIPAETGLLGIYIQILEVWIQDTRNKKRLEQREDNNEDTGEASATTLASPPTSTEGARSSTSYVPEVSLPAQLQTTEENGLLFLCSQSPTIRRYAISILKLAATFDRPEVQTSSAAGEIKEVVMPASVSVKPRLEVTRVYHLLQSAVQELLQVDECGNALKDCPLALNELIRLQIHHQKGSSEVFSLLAGGEHPADISIWRFCFPLLVTKIFQHFPALCEPCLDTVSKRLMQLYPGIVATTDLALNSTLASKFSIKNTQVATEEMVEQWRTYLIFVCSTMTRHEHPSPATPGHGRKKSAPSEKITCARDLFRLMLPLLYSDRHSIRESVVASLGRINVHLYKALLEDIQPLLFSVHDEFRSKNGTIKPPYQGKRNKKVDRLRAEIAHILDLTAPLLRSPALVHDEHITSSLKGYVRETLVFLVDSEVKCEWEFVKLRTHFCGFVCHLYNGISQIGNTEAIMPFDFRLAMFKLFEDWCGYGNGAKDDNKSFWFGMDLHNEAQISEKLDLELAALRAMASLCQGPINHPAANQRPDRPKTSFHIEEVFRWIESVFRSPEEKLHAIAQNALEALLIHNQDRGELLEDALHQCYAGDMSQKFIQGHFTALVDIILRIESYPCQVNQMLSLALFKCGDSNIHIRTLAIKLLKVIEARYFPETCAGEYEIGIVNKLPTIYRQAQYVLSARLAQDRPEQTYSLLSEAMMRFDLVRPVWRGEMLYYIAPWLGNVELVVDNDDELNTTSFVVLTNLFYLTVRYGDDHVKEVENLWVQLVAGDNFANIRPILVFLLDIGLEKRNPEFVHPAKKIIVFLGRTPACSRMVDILINEITPKAMVPKSKQERDHVQPPFATEFYLANLDSLMNGMEKRPAFSRGQLATVLLVDLAVEAGAELRRHLPLLLQALFVQLDHYTALICDQTRSLLVHLIHSVIIRESRSLETIDQSTELVDFLNTKEGKPLWAYDDIISLNMRESPELENLVYRSVQVFQASEVDIRQQWGETALQWATACPVPHIACRSFQIFRALAPSFNQHMLADMLARLSNTIGDKSQEIQAFAMEILISLQSIIESFDTVRMMQFPQIFWGSIACLYTGHDQEYFEGLKILEIVTNRLDLMDGPTLGFLLSYFPEHWDSAFRGIQPLLLKGLRSTMTEQTSLRLLRRMLFVSENALIDASNHRVVFLFLGLLPMLAEGLETKNAIEECLQWARDIATIAERDNYPNISHLLHVYARQRFRSREDFWRQIAVLMRDLFVPQLQAEMILFFMRLLYNSDAMYKHKALKCLKLLLPMVDTGRPEFLDIGPELVLPLLRLLLQAEYAAEALEVLDAAMNLSEQSTEIFKIRVPLDAQSPGPSLNFEDMTKGILGGGTGLERRAMVDAWTDPRREQFWQMTRANVNAVVLTCTGTGYWGSDVELLPEYETNFGFPVGQSMDFVDQDGLLIGLDSNAYGGAYGEAYGINLNDDLDRSQVQYGHLMSALDDLTEHFAESARAGDARKRESVAFATSVYADPSVQSQWNYRQSLLSSDLPLSMDVIALGAHQQLALSESGEGLGLSTGPGFTRSHQRHGRHGSRGSRDDFGGFYSPHHDRIVEDDEEESTLMANEILNQSLSIGPSYSSIRSSFVMDTSPFNTVESNSSNRQDTNAPGARDDSGTGPRLGSPVPNLGSTSVTVTRGPSGRVRLYASGYGHHSHRSSSSGSGGASTAINSQNGGTNLAPSSRSQGHRTESSRAGSNSSSTTTLGGGPGSTHGTTVSGHRTRASCDDLSLSSSDDDEEDDDSTDSDDDDIDAQSYSDRNDADTETLREAHEHQKRMQQRLHEQHSAADILSANSGLTMLKSPKPTLVARSTSASALPSFTVESASTKTSNDVNTVAGTKTSTGAAQTCLSGSTSNSPFFGAADHHVQHPTAAAQLRSATQSPAFLSKLYDAEHRLPSSIPWLALPGAATSSISGTESPNVFGRRRSDGGASASGTSTPGTIHDKHTQESSQQENPQPHPQPQHHHHHHLLSHQELAALSRNNSPMPLNEALPSYLRKKGGDTLQAMERSLSNTGSGVVHTGSGVVHTAPASPFVLPIHPTSLSVTTVSHGGASNNHTASPSHFLFPFAGSAVQTNRPEMERAGSTNVLPMNRQHQGQSRHNQQRNQAQFGANQGASASLGGLPAITGGSSGSTNSTGTLFRTSTPLGAPNLGGYGPHPTTFGSSPTKQNPFGHASDAGLPPNKEVHA